MDEKMIRNYSRILKEELVPAMGCTEPISIAYAAAVARETLGCPAERIALEVSGNIIKNVKSVTVPNTGGLRGIPAAAAAGMAAGDAQKQLEVISSVTPEQQERIRDYLLHTPIEVKLSRSPFLFDILLTAFSGTDRATVRIVNYHTNIVLIEKNGTALRQVDARVSREEGLTDKSVLSVEGILEFSDLSLIHI